MLCLCLGSEEEQKGREEDRSVEIGADWNKISFSINLISKFLCLFFVSFRFVFWNWFGIAD